MCRRFVSPDHSTIEREFDLVAGEWNFPANFNTAPGQLIPVIRVIEGQPDSALLRWGWPPGGGDEDADGAAPGDARWTTVPAERIRDAHDGEQGPLAESHRCIVPALGFYVWQRRADGAMQPFYVHAEDQEVFGFAAVWEADGCALVSVPAAAVVEQLSGASARMPAVLARDEREIWLYGTPARAGLALRTYPSDQLIAYRVTARVDSPDSNGESLIEPLDNDVD